VCGSNHMPPLVTSIATPEFGTRYFAYRDEIGLSSEDLDQIIEIVNSWRTNYIGFAERIADMGEAIDRELLEHHIDVAKTKDLCEQRSQEIRLMESEFVDRWEGLQNVLSSEQFDTLISLYKKEFQRLPHPILGERSVNALSY
jgi:hypothetical protein